MCVQPVEQLCLGYYSKIPEGVVKGFQYLTWAPKLHKYKDSKETKNNNTANLVHFFFKGCNLEVMNSNVSLFRIILCFSCIHCILVFWDITDSNKDTDIYQLKTITNKKHLKAA